MSALAITILLIAVLIGVVWVGGEWMLERSRERRRAQIERDLDRAEAKLRASILRLASDLNANAHEARKALIRESFLASRPDGHIPTGGR